MKILLTLTTLMLVTISCQNHTAVNKYRGRGIASTPILKMFFRELAEKSKIYSARELEEQAINYVKRQQGDLTHGNWSQMGIDAAQAKKLNANSLYDDVPHMANVRKWITENITKIAKIEKRFAKNAYDLVRKGQLGYKNPYAVKTVSTRISRQRKKLSPFKSIDDKQARVLAGVNEIADKATSREFRKQMVSFKRRGAAEPAILYNGLEMVESAASMTRITGFKSYGKGCAEFNDKMSNLVAQAKAKIDRDRELIIREILEKRVKKPYTTYKDIPVEHRLTQAEFDDSLVKAFQKSGYNDVEARAAINRLKRKPCQVY